jgi:hypothetical protein
MLNFYLFLAAFGTVFFTPVTGNELFRNISPEDEAPIPQHSDCKWSPLLSEKIEEFKPA